MEFDGIFLIEYEPTEDLLDGISRSLDYLNKLLAIREKSESKDRNRF